MNRDNYKRRLLELKCKEDLEQVHSVADSILCELLIDLGYGDIVKIYESLEKWYS